MDEREILISQYQDVVRFLELNKDKGFNIRFIPKFYLKKYSLFTIKNCILNYNLLTEELRKDVFISISNYLNLIKDVEPPHTISDCQYLYKNYVEPIVSFYLAYGFKQALSWSILFFVLILLLPIMFILKISIYWLMSIVFIFGILKIYLFIIGKNNKLYGPLY